MWSEELSSNILYVGNTTIVRFINFYRCSMSFASKHLRAEIAWYADRIVDSYPPQVLEGGVSSLCLLHLPQATGQPTPVMQNVQLGIRLRKESFQVVTVYPLSYSVPSMDFHADLLDFSHPKRTLPSLTELLGRSCCLLWFVQQARNSLALHLPSLSFGLLFLMVYHVWNPYEPVMFLPVASNVTSQQRPIAVTLS